MEIKEVPRDTLFLQINVAEGVNSPGGEKVMIGIAGNILVFDVDRCRYSISLVGLMEDVLDFHNGKEVTEFPE